MNWKPKIVLAFLAGTIFGGSLGFAGSAISGLNREEIIWRSLKIAYNLTVSGEAFARALRRFENGPPGIEMGHESPSNEHVRGHPLVPQGAVGYAKGVCAFQEIMQGFIWSNEWIRWQFCLYFAEKYHACHGEKNPKKCEKINKDYARILLKIWRQERALLITSREHEPYHPLDEAELKELAGIKSSKSNEKIDPTN